MVVTSSDNDMNVKAKSSSGGGCPIDHTKTINPSSWFRWSSSSTSSGNKNSSSTEVEKNTGGCPVKHSNNGGECPVKQHDKSSSSSSPFAIPPPPSLEQAANYAQTPQPDQQIPLSTHRVISSIPRGLTKYEEQSSSSSHLVEGNNNSNNNNNNWMYPSEQQFYNALRRKGWEGVEESNMPLVVRIHNAVNEKGWTHIRRWESICHSNTNPKLVKFMGRPQDLSPRAFVNTYLLGYHPPFDRHDWYVETSSFGDESNNNNNGPPRRYVIDFYSGKEDVRTNTPSMYLDVRPALDSPRDAFDRIQMFFIDSFPGIYNAISRPSNNNNWDTTTTMSPTTTRRPNSNSSSNNNNNK